MKNISLLCFLFIVHFVSAQSQWTEEDRQYLLDNLNRTTAELEKEVASLTDAQWHFKEKPESWSIAQVIEHLGIYERKYHDERYLIGLMPAEPELLETTKPDSYYLDWMAEETPHKASSSAKPLELMTGRNNWVYFLVGREMNVKRVIKNKVDFRTHFTYRSKGQRWNIHQLYIILFAHCDRHLRQIKRIKAHPEFPKAGLSLNEEKELAAIMQTIEAETDCFFSRDYDCWKEHWAQEDQAYQAWNNSDGSFYARVGWESLNEAAMAYIKQNPTPPDQSKKRKVIRKNMTIQFYGDSVAYLVWDQYNEKRNTNQFTHSKDTRIMEKHNGKWKIAHVSSFWDYKNLIKEEDMKD